MDMQLAGKTALVTAGSKGMGRAIAIAFAREGMNVAVSARGQESLDAALAEIQGHGDGAIAIQGDVSDPGDIERMVARTAREFGGIDVLVVNAGGPPGMQFDRAGDTEWESAFHLTLMSAVRLIRAALPHLTRSSGSIITIESISVKQPVRGLLLSNAIRPAVIGLAKTLADEVGPSGVRINNILPGMIMTDRARSLAQARADQSGRSLDDVIAETESNIPVGRYGEPEEIANLALFLASSVSSYITGTSILCDGGLYRGLM